MPEDTLDNKFMRAALREAARGLGHTSPNPAVGAVIVRGGRMVGRGWHRQAGAPHAEIEAIRSLKRADLTRGTTMYVTLEPCSTYGRTPPCVDAIIRHGFARVVIGATDPNPHHAGRGLEILRAAGIEVTAGVLEAQCAALNAAFNHWIVTGRPFVIAKAGLSLDGRFTRPPGEGQWLTNEAARIDAMRLRAQVDAILVGAETVRADNPRLTLRGVPEEDAEMGDAETRTDHPRLTLPGITGTRQPWRVIVTRSGRLPAKAHLFTDEHRDRTLVYRAKSLDAVLRDLGKRQITSVVIEGGGQLLGEAFDRRLVNRVHFYLAPLICGGPVVIGGRGASSTAESTALKNAAYTRIGDDLRLQADI
ncbi:MAG: bifunctional diaminohydroxyphosphoribosylaminopyrimidine deaminase/5-amino-6-(5-phosphoribosylamino)uracil reductase RibD [Verrucomicrobiota bacterium]|nr:bifunctional diaminohydroxyphosphoribosylaminopyrimidine deaminase/5-amino-6-(5-phosphoribosylamino)uracil reductase RibD [Verrucomicrobiota bacterium]